MKVLQLAKYYPPIYGGIELVEKMMTIAHRETGDEVTIHAFHPLALDEVGDFGEKIIRIKENFKILNAPFSLKYFFSFKNLINKNSSERIYVHLPNPFMHELVRFYYQFIKKKKIEIWAIYHSDIVNKSFFGIAYNWYFKQTCHIYDKVIVSSDNLWNSSHVLSGLDKRKKLVIPFCIEEDKVDLPIRDGLKKKLVTVGRFVPYKGFDFLINALKNSKYELHIIGNGPLYGFLKKISGPNVFIHSNLNHHEKNKLIASSDILLVGSRNRAEAYGMTIVEAFSYGVPVIASNLNTGVTYLVQDEVTGLTYEVDNEADFLEKLNRLSTDDGLWRKLSRQCREFYESELTYSMFKKRLVGK